MINQQLVNTILNEIAELEREYQLSQGLILTEDDLKCHLFSKIKSILPQAMPTLNTEILGSPLHSEVKFFDEEDKLTLRPDLCVINPDFLSIYHSVEFEIKRGNAMFKKYSSKCFEIGGSAILIELKFCRSENGICDDDKQSFENDVLKINKLQTIVSGRSNGHDTIYGIFAIFNKTNQGKEKFDVLKVKYKSSPNLHLVYATGNVNFAGINPNLYGSGFQADIRQIC